MEDVDFDQGKICAACHDRSCGNRRKRLCADEDDRSAAGHIAEISGADHSGFEEAWHRGRCTRQGRRLSALPQEYKVGEILRLTEGGSMAPVHCLSCDATPCERRGECRTIAMWNELSHLINAYLDGITIADLMHKSDRQCPEDQEKKRDVKIADMSINS